MRDGLQRLDREGLEDQNEEAKSLKDRIGKLDEQINGFDSQLDIHMKGGVSGTAYESDPAKNDGFIRTLNERIDEVKKSVKDAEAQMETQTEQLRKEESAIRELEARVQEAATKMMQQTDLLAVASRQGALTSPREPERAVSSGQYQDVYIKNSRALIIHLSMRLEELTKGLLQRELMLLSQNVLIRKNDLVRQELETQIELLGLQVSRLSQAVTGGRNERDETDYQDKSRKLQEKLAGMRDGLQRLDREGLEDQNEEAKSLKDRIGKLDEQINGFDSQLDIHMKGGVSGTAYESDPAKNDGFIRTLNERIDEVKKSVKDAEAQMETQTEQLRKEESAIRELEARVQEAATKMMQQTDLLAVASRQGGLTSPREPERAVSSGQYQDVYIKNSRALIIHLSMRLEELTKGLLQRELMLLSQNVLIRKNDLVPPRARDSNRVVGSASVSTQPGSDWRQKRERRDRLPRQE